MSAPANSGSQTLLIDADDTLWENNIYFERAFDEFCDFLSHSTMTPQQVRDVHAAGGELIVSPNFNAAVITEAAKLGMVCLPGVMTPTEAFGALAAGATGLKLFPAELASPAVVKALLAVLPAGTPVMPVGGITPLNMAEWRAAGAAGFGIGSALYKPGKQAAAVRDDAKKFISAWTGTTNA